MEWLQGNSIGSVLWHIIEGTDVEIPFNIWAEDGKFYNTLFAKQNFCQIRFEDKLPREIMVMAYDFRGGGPYWFVWLEKGQVAQLKPQLNYAKPLSIKSLAIGDGYRT